MRPFISTMPKPCVLCNETMTPGCEIWPAQGPDGVQCGRYSHLECAKDAAAQQQPEPDGHHPHALEPPLCKHWVRKGLCLMGPACFYRHPAESCGAALVIRPPRERGTQAKRRANVRNKWRCGMLRTWLMSRWGPQLLEQGSGVLDVAGGKGELAYELVNLSGVPATVVDPRPLLLSVFEKRLQNGSYHHKQNCGGTNRRSLSDCSSSGSLEPAHLRMPLTLELVAALAALHKATAAAAAAAARDSGTGEQPLVQQQQQGPEHDEQRRCQQGELSRLRQRCRQLVSAGMEAAAAVDSRVWWVKADGHEAGGCHCCIGGNNSGSEADEPAAAAAEAERCLLAGALSGLQLSTQQQLQPSEEEGSQQQQQAEQRQAEQQQAEQQQAEQQQAEQQEADQRQAEQQQLLDTAITSLLSCSVVMGMHPDQAAEPIVALALALQRPFALVPCCVYAAEFPKRRLNGQPVRSYDDLLDYLQGLVTAAPGGWQVGRELLPFEGKNVMLWGRPPAEA